MSDDASGFLRQPSPFDSWLVRAAMWLMGAVSLVGAILGAIDGRWESLILLGFAGIMFWGLWIVWRRRNEPKPVQLTQFAAEVASKFVRESGSANARLRVAVRKEATTGGAYELVYRLDVSNEATPQTHVLYESQQVPMAVERESLPLLKDTVIDYGAQEGGAGFLFRNPQDPRNPPL